MTFQNKPIFGVDIGGVIIDKIADNTDTSFFSNNYLQTPPVPGVFAALAKLSAAGFRIHLVSKCGESVQRKSLKWLEHHDFYQVTGVARNDVHFCLTRKEKAGICKKIDATHFVDDRLEVLSYLDSVPHLYLINAGDKEVRKFQWALDKVVRVYSWEQLVPIICETICRVS